MIDLSIELDDTAGELARLGEALGSVGVNIGGICAVTAGGPTAIVHVLVADPEPAFEALAAAGLCVRSEEEVAVIDVEDRPGIIGEISRRLGDAG
ncbi:MAG: amino acid-binding protein, partial [Acidimicrobiales bacterium]